MDDDITDIVIAVFRLNGTLLEAGDKLTEPFGVTSARWQVMGAIALNAKPLTIPRIAEYMGVSRQAVLKQIKLMAADGLVHQQANESHKRADLWSLTATGDAKYADIMATQRLQVTAWRGGLSQSEIQECTRVLASMESCIKKSSVVDA